ncbi:hypothetical protein [Rhodospirillum sp. A1_3_36]|uniref:DUF7424 family protein n=1 Tax=Rhodospirillum sp. A1_3_36 TaxID=3391666 RepID=UPI0039A61830
MTNRPRSNLGGAAENQALAHCEKLREITRSTPAEPDGILHTLMVFGERVMTMIKQKIKILTYLLVAGTGLSGCKPETAMTVYLSDIQAAVAGEVLTSEARLSVPMPNAEKCQEYGPTVTEALTPYLPNIRNPQCRKTGMDNALDVTFDIAVLKNGEDRDSWPIMAVAATESEAGDAYRIALTLNREQVGAAQAAVERKLSGAPRANLEETKVTVSFANDLKDVKTMMVGSVFVGDVGVPFQGEYEVRRREELRVVFSDVTTARLFQSGETEFGLLFKEPIPEGK